MRLVTMNDPAHTARVTMVMTSLVQSVRDNSRYWKITDYTLEHIIRMAKKSPEVYTWLNTNQPVLDGILGWVKLNTQPPPLYSREQQSLQLLKPTQNPSWVHQAHHNAAMSQPYGQLPAVKFQLLQLIKEGKSLDVDIASDSDMDFSDRTFKLHEWVDGQDTSNNWYPSQIIDVDSTGTRVRIHFDGWTSKWDEDMYSHDPRLRPLGTFCTTEQITNRGKPRKDPKPAANTNSSSSSASDQVGSASAAAQPESGGNNAPVHGPANAPGH